MRLDISEDLGKKYLDVAAARSTASRRPELIVSLLPHLHKIPWKSLPRTQTKLLCCRKPTIRRPVPYAWHSAWEDAAHLPWQQQRFGHRKFKGRVQVRSIEMSATRIRYDMWEQRHRPVDEARMLHHSHACASAHAHGGHLTSASLASHLAALEASSSNRRSYKSGV